MNNQHPNPVDPKFNAARQLYAEQFGNALVTNTYLRIALLAMSLVCMASIYSNVRTARMVQNFKPLVVRINDVGRAEAISYSNFAYRPQEAEIKYFLSEFCRLYYTRSRFTIRDNFHKALLFTDAQLGNGLDRAWSKDKIIETYLEGQQADIDISIAKVSIEDLRSAPFKATVDFYEIFYNPVDRTETKRVLYTAHFVFFFRDSVPNDLIQVNPLGLAITYFREDAAFQ
ncbi:MAG TPA: VirB8/TrbF family protein [Candidatus Angelobacter sp.]|nr:VirB8/TrbF family protein [Candidatus Angelobacter sp.]